MLTLPERPEAYFLLSNFYRERDHHQDAYISASQGLKYIDNADNEFRFDVGYDGEIGLLFEKAVSGWYWGKVDESVSILNQIYNSENSTYRKKAKISLSTFNKWDRSDIDLSRLNKNEINDLAKDLLDDELYELWKNKNNK